MPTPREMTRDTGLHFSATVHGAHIIAADALWLHCIARNLCPTTAVPQPATPVRVAALTEDTLACLPQGCGCLVFVPSYRALAHLHPLIAARLHRHAPPGVDVMVEARDAEAHAAAVAKFNSTAAGRTRVFLCVHRGKVSEGVEFQHGAVHLVVSVGIPYPNQDQHFKDRMLYLRERYSPRDADRWMKRQAYTQLYQCLGRCVRGRTDRGAILLGHPVAGRRVPHLCSSVAA